MKKYFTKGFSVFILALLLAAMAIPVSATKEVTVTSNIDGLNPDLVISNKISSNQASDRTFNEGWLIKSGLITFTFSEEMDVSTLTPENITITPANTNYVKSELLNEDGTLIYEPYAVTSTTYTIAIGDMLEGKKQHNIVFTSGVKTAAGEEMTPYETGFITGRIAKMPVQEGKVIKNVAYGKSALRDNNDGTTLDMSKWTSYAAEYNSNVAAYSGVDKYTRIDLGNYYDVADIAVVTAWGTSNGFNANLSMNIYYSCDPEATGAEATLWGEVATGQYYQSGGTTKFNTSGGLGGTRWLHPQNPVRARYIFLKTSGGTYGEQICNVEVLTYVDTDYGALTATKDGEAVTSFAGAGTYQVTSAVNEYFSGTADSYMIVVGYDANGVVTNINCAPVSKSEDNTLSLETTFGANTVSMKACLIKSFSQPQMLVDALTLAAQ